MPVFRSTWCGRRSSPVSLSSMNELAPRAWCDRRMFRREGEVFLLGTAIEVTLLVERENRERRLEQCPGRRVRARLCPNLPPDARPGENGLKRAVRALS